MGKRVGANRRRSSINRKKKIGSKVKSSMRSFIITILIIFGISVLTYAGIKGFKAVKTYIDNSDHLSVKDIVIEGAVRSIADSIRVKSAVAPGMKLYAVENKNIVSSIGKDIWIDKVDIVKRLNGLVYIKITERKPIAIVNIGEIKFVDRNGILLPFNFGTLLESPLFIGLKDSTDSQGRAVIVKRDLDRLLSFLNNTKKIRTLNETVSQVDFSKADRIRLSCRASKVLLEIDSNRVEKSIEWLNYIEPVLSKQIGRPALVNMMYQDLAFVVQENTAKKKAE